MTIPIIPPSVLGSLGKAAASGAHAASDSAASAIPGVSQLNSAADAFDKITNPGVWKRVLTGIGGAYIVYIGILLILASSEKVRNGVVKGVMSVAVPEASVATSALGAVSKGA